MPGEAPKIYFWECEHLEPLPAEERRAVGTLYAVPYASPQFAGSRIPAYLNSFAGRVGATLTSRMEEAGLAADVQATFGYRLTPAMPHGVWREPARVQGSALSVEIAVGVAPDLWAGLPVRERRELLARLGAAPVWAFGRELRWRLPTMEDVLRTFSDEHSTLAGARADSEAASVEVPTDVWRGLSLAEWNRATNSEQAERVDALTDAMRAAAIPVRPLGVSRFGPAGDPAGGQPVARWLDESTGLTFCLVCGGTIRPGFDEERIRRYREAYDLLGRPFETSEKDANEDGGDAARPPNASPEAPLSVRTYDSDVPTELRQRNAVTVPPMLMAAQPVLRDTPGVRDVVNLGRIRIYGGAGASPLAPLYLEWLEVRPLLRRFGWGLPSSEELEWAVKGGRETLFHWGDEPGKLLLAEHSMRQPDPSDETDIDRLRDAILVKHFSRGGDAHPSWPRHNRFGLEAPLAHATWCLPCENPDDAFPLVSRGGAAALYPWQACNEWMLLLTAAESRQALDRRTMAPSASVRPVWRLRPRGA